MKHHGFILLLLAIFTACGGNNKGGPADTPVTQPAEAPKQPDTTSQPATNGNNATPRSAATATLTPPPFMALAYQHPSLPAYTLIGIFGKEAAPRYFVQTKEELRLLTEDEAASASNTIAIVSEGEGSINQLEWHKEAEIEQNGITAPQAITIHLKNGKSWQLTTAANPPVFRPVTGKYTYKGPGEEAALGELELKQATPNTSQLTISTNTGSPRYHNCEFEQELTVTWFGNWFYYQGKPYGNTCSFVGYSTDNKVQVFTLSNNTDCGCGASATLDGIYRAGK